MFDTSGGEKPELKMILDGLDSDYTQFCRDILEDTCGSSYSHHMESVCGQLSVGEELVYGDGSRIVLPNKSIKPVLSLLHSSHAGLVLSCTSSSAGSPTLRGQGSHVPPHGPYCLALYRAQAHCLYCPPMGIMGRQNPRALVMC